MTMYCEKYKCTMPEKTCLLRQKKYDGHVAFYTVNRDPGCADCAQGKQIRQQMKMKGKTMTNTEARVYQAPAAGKAAGMDAAAELDALEAAAKKRKTNDQPVDQHEMASASASASAKQALKRCPKCEKHLPADLDHFYEDTRGRLNLSCWCKECQRARGRQQKRQQRRVKQMTQDAERAEAPDAVPAKDVPEIEPEWIRPKARRTVTLDFTNRAEMLEKIEKAADLEYRTVEQEILYWASLGLRGLEKWIVDQANETPFWAQEEVAP